MLVDLTETDSNAIYRSVTIMVKGIRKNINFRVNKHNGDTRINTHMVRLGLRLDRTLWLWTDDYIPPKPRKKRRKK
jgi:hypothetical protein